MHHIKDDDLICPECLNTDPLLMDAAVICPGGPHCILCNQKNQHVHVITWKRFKRIVQEWKEKALVLIKN